MDTSLAAAAELGKTAHTITKTVNIALLPLAAVNFAYDKFRKYCEARFERDLQDKLSDAPADALIEPKPSLAGPVLQGLAFSHDEQTLRELYLSLLASAMNKTTASVAHPAFVEVIKQLTASEAQGLCTVLQPPDPKPIAQIRVTESGSNRWRVVHDHLLPVTDAKTNAAVEDPLVPAMVDNWIRLGLIEVSYTEFLEADRYVWAKARPEFLRFKSELENRSVASPPEALLQPHGPVRIQPGRLRVTAFGAQFYKTLRLDKVWQGMVSGGHGIS